MPVALSVTEIIPKLSYCYQRIYYESYCFSREPFASEDSEQVSNTRNRPFQGSYRHIAGGAKTLGRARGHQWRP